MSRKDECVVEKDKREIYVENADVYLIHGLALDVEFDYISQAEHTAAILELEDYIQEEGIHPVKSENGYIDAEEDTIVYIPKTGEIDYAVGFYDQDKLIAVLDLISGYPDEKTAWIGFFMVDAAVQGKGIGSKIFVGIESELKDLGLSRVELAFAKGNAKSEKFLLKNGYQKTGQELNVPGYTVVVVEKML